MDDQGQVDIQASGPRDTRAVGPGAQRRDGADVGSVEEVVLDAHHRQVGVLAPAGLRVEETDPPRPETSVEPSAAEDRDRRAAAVEPDAARIEQLNPTRRAEVEQRSGFQEEFALFGEEEWKAGEVDDLLVGLDLSEVGVGGEVRRQCRRQPDFRIDAGLGAEERAARFAAETVVFGLDGATEGIGVHLERARAMERPEARDRALMVEVVEALRPPIRAP